MLMKEQPFFIFSKVNLHNQVINNSLNLSEQIWKHAMPKYLNGASLNNKLSKMESVPDQLPIQTINFY
jgi:hypothetical protein